MPGPSAPAAAQAGTIERSAQPANAANRDQATRKDVKSAAKTNATAKTSNAQRAGATAPGPDAWTISDALPKDSKAIPAETPAAAKKDFGRLQLDTGSVGLQMESQFKEGQFADGRRVPGLETVKREQPGLSGYPRTGLPHFCRLL